MWLKKIFILVFFLCATNVNAFNFDFSGVSGTDLNVLYSPDWNSIGNTSGWYQKTINNLGEFYVANDGVGGTTTTRIMNNDFNFSTSGDSLFLEFTLIDVNRIAGTIEHNFAIRWLNANIDGNILAQIDIRSTTTDLNYLLYAGGVQIANNTADLNDTFKMVATRKLNNFIYDFDYYVNNVLIISATDVNVNTDSFRNYLRAEAGDPAVGRVIFKIDDLQSELPPATADINYSNFTTYLGKSYTKNLNYLINYTCLTGVDANITRAINDINDLVYTLSCDDTLKQISASYTHNIEGLFNIKFYLYDNNSLSTSKFSDQNFISDLNKPVADVNFAAISGGFSSSVSQVPLSLKCTDIISPKIFYTIQNEFDVNLLHAQYDANSTQTLNVDVNTGTNIFEGFCRDLVGDVQTDQNTVEVFSNCFNLVDEQTGVALSNADVNLFTGLTATGYETQEVFNFKSPLATSTCYSSTIADTVRFDLNYSSGTQLYKEFSLEILQDINTSLPVCIADDQDFFEQLFTASQERKVILKNQLSGCYSLVDYTKYALQDTLSHRAFTIQMPYNLQTDVDGNTVILALINGAIESTINLDVLVFKNQTFSTGLQPDELSVALYVIPPLLDSNTVVIYYNNLAANNTSANIKIFDGNTQIYTQTITSTPNAFTVYFDTTTIDVNSDVLKIQITKTLSDGTTEVITRYFTMSGSQAIFPSGLGILFSFILVLFGFTLIRWSYVLGWFGLLVAIAGIAILGFTAQTGQVIFLQAVLLIAGVYIFIIFKDETVRTV